MTELRDRYIRFDWAIKRLLTMGLTSQQVADGTGLPLADVEQLKQNM